MNFNLNFNFTSNIIINFNINSGKIINLLQIIEKTIPSGKGRRCKKGQPTSRNQEAFKVEIEAHCSTLRRLLYTQAELNEKMQAK